MSIEDRNEGVSPLFAPLLEQLLDTPAPTQVRHRVVRGRRVAKCGSYEGQQTKYRAEVTCPACKAAR